MELFGPDFENYEQVQQQIEQQAEEKEREKEEPAPGSGDVQADKSKAKKGKIAAKSTGHTYQFQILESIGVPRAEIKTFADPLHWLTYFPPIAIVSFTLSNSTSNLTLCTRKITPLLVPVLTGDARS